MSSSSDAEDEGRPTWFDGKVEREVWQPGDGNGDATPELIEKSKNKKGGHPSWKLFMGDVLTEITPTNPPTYCYLDDKALWAIHKSLKWTKQQKVRYWPFDFTNQGRVSTARPTRGRPAFIDGKLASLPRPGRKTYWFCGSGSLKAPIPPQPAPPKEEDAAAKGGKTQGPSQTPAPFIEKSVRLVAETQRTEKPTLMPLDQSAEKPPVKPAYTPADHSVDRPAVKPVIQQPVVQQPVVSQPLFNQPLVNQPLVNKSLASKPLVKQPLVQQPMFQQPVAMPSTKPLEKPAEVPSGKPMSALGKPQEQVPARPHEETSKNLPVEPLGEKTSTDADAMALVRLRQMSTMTVYSESSATTGPRNSSALVASNYDFSAYTARVPSMESRFNDRLKASASSSSGASKRSSSPASPLPPPKRQRSRLEPHVLPPEVTEREGEMERLRVDNRRLRGFVAYIQNQSTNDAAQDRRKDAMITQANKERDAWKFVALKYHTERLDVLDGVAHRHKAGLKVIQNRKDLYSLMDAMMTSTVKELGSLQDDDRALGQTPEEIERYFRENGMERQWREFEAEAGEQ